VSAQPALRFQRVWKSYPRWPSGTRTVRALVTRRMPLLGRSGRTWALGDGSFGVAGGASLGGEWRGADVRRYRGERSARGGEATGESSLFVLAGRDGAPVTPLPV